jgi:tetratricopeptide (TPR) repeat protein
MARSIHNSLGLALLTLGGLSVCLSANAQTAHSHLRKADKFYRSENYQQAEEYYRKAESEAKSPAIPFNLGNSLYRQNRLEEGIPQYDAAANASRDAALRAKAFHNLGNSYYGLKQYDKSIEAYKNALKIAPADTETKHNLALAQQQLQQQEQQQQNQQQQKKESSDQQQQNQSPQNQNQQPQPGVNKTAQQNKQPESPGEQQPQPQPHLSRDEAQRLLDIMDREEQKVQEKLRKGAASPSRPAKDW